MGARILAACGVLAVLASIAPAGAQSVRFGGYLSTRLQLGLTGCDTPGECRFLNFRNANVLGLILDATPSATTEVRADVAIRNTNFTQIETLDDTGDISEVQPVDIRLNEARVTLYDLFGAPGLDLAAGAMRIAWGTADGINPTDVVNPYNLEDATGFDKRLASLAVRLGYGVAGFRIEAVMVPLFLPAILPIDNVDFTTLGRPQDVFGLADTAGAPPSIRQVDTPVTTPDFSAENIQAGARLRYASAVGDFSLMYYRGFESLPQASGEVRLTGFQTQNRIDLGVPLVYPRIMMAGADWRGPLVEKLSGWVELGVFFPESHRLTANRTQLEALVNLGRLDEVPDPLPSQVTQDDQVYVKAVVGLDYPAGDYVYLNLQYIRGMPTERQASDIHDYALLAMRVTLLDGRLELAAHGALEVASAETFGYQAGGAISYLHGDAARLTLGTTFQGGHDGATFDRFSTLSNLYLDVSIQF